MKPTRPGPGTVIFAAALLLRAAWVLVRWSTSGPALEFPDEELHWQLARNLVEQGTLVSDDGRYAARLPGYPCFLAIFAGLGETGILVARLAQALLGAATAWIAWVLARRALDRRAALVAGGLVCLDPYAIFFANLLLTEVLFSAFAIGLTACAWLLLDRAQQLARGPTIGVALLGAAALITRPSATGWIILLWAVLWLVDQPRARSTRRLTLYLATVAACLLSWGLRNRAVIGAPAWLSTNGGVTLYDAQGPQADGSSDQTFLQQLPQLVGLNEVETDRTLRRLALDQIRSDPTRVLSLARTKFLRTWSLKPNVAEHHGGVTGLVSAVFTTVILLLALTGVVRLFAQRSAAAAAIRPRRRLHMLLWLPVIYFTLLHCVFVGSLRYRVPLMPFMELAAAAAFVQSPTKRIDSV